MRISLKKGVTLCLFATFLTLSCVHAQKEKKLYNKGLYAFYDEDFPAAAYFFQEISASGKSYKDSDYRLELSLLTQKAYRERPLDAIIKYSEIKQKTDKFYHYWMGRVFANRYMFPEAVESWQKFLKQKAYKSEEIVMETKDFIAQTERLIAFFDNPDNYEVHQLGKPINTEYAELSPVYFEEKDELLFASNRVNPDQDDFIIYQATSGDMGWNAPTEISVLGSFKREMTNVEVVNNDGKLFHFNAKKGDLFYSELTASGWTKPVEFDSKITSTKLGSHFYINEHEDRIIFASKNKKNGLDLMESFKDAETGKWEKPHPFATNLNSTANEDSPFLSEDETKFYFSSDRPNGVGGYDLYVSELDPETRQWSDPVNMGWPINSPDDEVNFKINPDLNSGYFSSNRIHSIGDYDIYFFWKIQKTTIEGRVIDGISQEPVTHGEIRFHPAQYLDEYFRSKLDSSGRYKTNIIANESFRVEVLQGFDTLMNQIFTVDGAEGDNVIHFKDFYLLPPELEAEQRAALEAQFNQEPEENQDTKQTQEITSENTSDHQNTTLRNVYFEFGTSQLRKESDPKLNKLLTFLTDNPNIRIEVSGHTDNIGSKQANLIVSQRRAESVKNWLVEKGIDPSRITTTGYGESRPMASNDDEVDGRALNRRIEFRVLH